MRRLASLTDWIAGVCVWRLFKSHVSCMLFSQTAVAGVRPIHELTHTTKIGNKFQAPTKEQ